MNGDDDGPAGGSGLIAELDLTPVEARVIGALIEKQLSTPQQYPLTLNALVAACNQTSSRDPIVSYDERTVDTALAVLKLKGVVRFVHPSHGRSVTRYRQVLEEVLGLEVPSLALLAVLLLRGPQTVGELRTRTERMAEFASLADVEDELDGLAARHEPLVTRLSRQPGRKDVRYVQLLAADTGAAAVQGSDSDDDLSSSRLADEGEHRRRPPLAAQVAELQAEVAALRRDLDEVLSRLTDT